MLKLATLPRVRLAALPTPLQELKNFSKLLGGPRIFMKRDDMTGLAFGGNKTRKLEYLMGEAVANGANAIVTSAGFQSNWCTQTAAAAIKLGMKCILVKKTPVANYEPPDYDGNHLLHVLMGVEIRTVRPEQEDSAKQQAMQDLTAAGYKPWHLKVAGSTAPGCVGYANAILEMTAQAVEMGIGIDYLVHASGSGGTQAGLVIGAKAMNTGIRIIGSTTGSRSGPSQTDNVLKIIEAAKAYMGVDVPIDRDDVVVHDKYAGDGYGFMSEPKAEAIKLLAETEGLYIDPVYTGSATACLIDLVRKKRFKPDDVVVLLHTGGPAALFAYKEPLKTYLAGQGLAWKIPPWSPEAGSKA